jgi:hypothetical protein
VKTMICRDYAFTMPTEQFATEAQALLTLAEAQKLALDNYDRVRTQWHDDEIAHGIIGAKLEPAAKSVGIAKELMDTIVMHPGMVGVAPRLLDAPMTADNIARLVIGLLDDRVRRSHDYPADAPGALARIDGYVRGRPPAEECVTYLVRGKYGFTLIGWIASSSRWYRIGDQSTFPDDCFGPGCGYRVVEDGRLIKTKDDAP